MNREFLEVYNQELALLKDHAREFAAEFPGIAERLGGLLAERTDPMVEGLLEGAAFLAARVQLKLKHEFTEFTSNLIEQLLPGYLAPIPSAILARFAPPYGDPALRDGRQIARASYIDATYVERERRVACRFMLRGPVTLWPFEITQAEYFAAPGPVQALGVPIDRRVLAGLRLTLTCRARVRPEDEPNDEEAKKDPLTLVAGCRLRSLPVHLVGPEADAVALYEQLFANRAAAYVRWHDEFGDPVVERLPEDAIKQIGFDPVDSLFPEDLRIFRGFALLREYFVFARRFLAFEIGGLERALPRIATRSFEVIVTFDSANPRLAVSVRPDSFALYTAPAVNLFEKTTDRIPVTPSKHEYVVVPDRSRYLDFEPHRVLDVFAHFPGVAEKQRVHPLYSAAVGAGGGRHAHYYTVRRLPRRRTVEEKAYGAASDYTGTDMFLTLSRPTADAGAPAPVEISLRAMCSNRHLTEHLPVGAGGADFRLLDDGSLDIMCAAGPTRPRPPIASPRAPWGVAERGTTEWRLINMLSLNHLGLAEHGAGGNAQALREVLGLFVDASDNAIERRIRGIRSVESRPVVRRVRDRLGVGVARGTEVTVTFDEKAYEGSGVFLIGAVLDRFFAEYAAMNHFTQLVVRTLERGVIMRWPPRSGSRRPL